MCIYLGCIHKRKKLTGKDKSKELSLEKRMELTPFLKKEGKLSLKQNKRELPNKVIPSDFVGARHTRWVHHNTMTSHRLVREEHARYLLSI